MGRRIKRAEKAPFLCDFFNALYLCSTKRLLLQHQVFTSVAPTSYLCSTKHYFCSTKWISLRTVEENCGVLSVAPSPAGELEPSGGDFFLDHLSHNPTGFELRKLAQHARLRSGGDDHRAVDEMAGDDGTKLDGLLGWFLMHTSKFESCE